MKKLLRTLLLVCMVIMFVGCRKPFKFGSDKFYLELIYDGGMNSTHYSFCKEISDDIVLKPISEDAEKGYEIVGVGNVMGLFTSTALVHSDENTYLQVTFCCYYENMGENTADVKFNYTVKSTGERKNETWVLDFTQKPYEDKRSKNAH